VEGKSPEEAVNALRNISGSPVSNSCPKKPQRNRVKYIVTMTVAPETLMGLNYAIIGIGWMYAQE
jgi:hypothetical protein